VWCRLARRAGVRAKDQRQDRQCRHNGHPNAVIQHEASAAGQSLMASLPLGSASLTKSPSATSQTDSGTTSVDPASSSKYHSLASDRIQCITLVSRPPSESKSFVCSLSFCQIIMMTMMTMFLGTYSSSITLACIYFV
jgi:hypothetical protein